MRDVIAIDASDRQFYGNQLFEQSNAGFYPGLGSIISFKKIAENAGFQVITADLAGQLGIDPRRIMVISSERLNFSKMLAGRGGLLSALICFETPSFAWHFYHNLDRISSDFRHVFLFPGAAPRLRRSKAHFHPQLFPQPFRQIQESGRKPWEERKFAAMVHYNRVRRIIKPGHIIAAFNDPDLRGELYSERRKAIRYFSGRDGFHLYGGGWDKLIFGVSYGDYRAGLKCYQGKCQNKIDTLSDYRFSICYENAIFPGYITEKIFDCFYAGCIPVYLGAPDVQDYIPRECFIDKRQFKTYRELDRYLLNIDKKGFSDYHRAIDNFLRSEQFLPFYQETFARDLLNAVKECSEA